ncbi:MAG: hypothetical protein EAX96_16995 [Candidatus Lokiarchaeota archaeon]|nr:hypothetical protein [Candidatus Lokiarchaeota archaeon]
MSEKKSKYLTVREIDGRSGIHSPHKGELRTIEKGILEIFEKNEIEIIKPIVETRLQGKVENINFDEDYTITLELFPEVKIHMLYNNYDKEEDEALRGSEMRFLFSGNRVAWIPSEDLGGFIESSLNYLESIIKKDETLYEIPSQKSDFLKKAIKQRIEPFKNLKLEDMEDLARFVGGSIEKKQDEMILTKKYFRGINIILKIDKNNKNIDVFFSGENTRNINNFVKDLFAIYLINHCLRFIKITYLNVSKLPIIKKIFSFSYQKTQF